MVLEVSAHCALQNTQDLNVCPLCCTFLVDDFWWHLVFSHLHTSTAVVFRPWRINGCMVFFATELFSFQTWFSRPHWTEYVGTVESCFAPTTVIKILAKIYYKWSRFSSTWPLLDFCCRPMALFHFKSSYLGQGNSG